MKSYKEIIEALKGKQLDEISLDLAKRARDKAEHIVDMDYDDLRDKPFGHSEKQRVKFQKYIDKKEAKPANHTSMSRARHLARRAIKNQMKEQFELDITDEQADTILDAINEQVPFVKSTKF